MNGCICCTVRSDLIDVIAKLAERSAAGELRLDGIIIETTGMADPAPVAQTFFVNKAVETFCRLDGIVTLVDAMHIEQHLDEEKPEGAENEAVEQVAFADRMLLNKTDLVSEEDLVRVEGRLRSINAFAPIERTVQSKVEVNSVLDVCGFDLERTLTMDPEFLNTEGEHVHDQSVTSLSIVHDGGEGVDFEAVQDWVHTLLTTQGINLFRLKGVLHVAGTLHKYVFQAVHMVFRWSADESWGDDEARVTRLVFIGKHLDHAALRAGFDACVLSPKLTEIKAARQAAATQVAGWAREALPAAYADATVRAEQIRSSKPESPIETVLTVALPKSMDFTVAKPLLAITRDDVVAKMDAWASMLKRAATVQAWAEAALPKVLAGQRVLVDELETSHRTRPFETCIHVLATPPWSMKVIKPLEEVTNENVTNVMFLATLCGSGGVPTVS